jgi:hypothetical protein
MKKTLAWFALALASCAAGANNPAPAPIASTSAPSPSVAEPSVAEPAAPVASAPAASSAAPAPPAFVQSDRCPANMALVSGSFCPKVERKCIHEERIVDEHITICHEFAPETKCLAPREDHTFCIDRFEYPNEEGAHPPWMVTWYDAQATCEMKGKRVCYESEWTMACEGPGETPFPYGWARDNTACNIDNQFIRPVLYKMTAKDPKVNGPELERLDQSVASGALARCVSGYGVHDMTGNFDEWVTREASPWGRRKDDIGEFAGLKGGGWGHVRNACRPMTTSHSPGFAYYFITFRCCAEAKGATPFVPKNAMRPPKVAPEDKAPLPHPTHAPGPSAVKVEKDRGY